MTFGELVAAIVAWFKGSSGAVKRVLTMEEAVKDAIKREITDPLGLPPAARAALFAQAVVETGRFKSKAFQATNSLFNRHVGSGRGDWRGSGLNKSQLVLGVHVFFANPKDPDLRMFTDVYQSARDMRQLLQDGLYRAALAALRRGSAPDYFRELKAAGFAEEPAYVEILTRTWAGEQGGTA